MAAATSSQHEVHLAIYDLSHGMARGLSAQFLGPQHAIDIVPHTAIVAYGKEYFFGQGIQWMSPHEFRRSRGIHPIIVQLLGRTSRTEREFEDWCRAQAANGSFGPQSYDLLTRNCNNFSEEAARYGLRLPEGVPQWILEVPQKFLSSPMGMAMRPMLEQMQITSTAPTNLPPGAGAGAGTARPTPAPAPPAASAAAAANPWADLPSPASATTSPARQGARATPLLDKQAALLSKDTGVVKACVDRLDPGQEERGLLLKLADEKASWTRDDVESVHRYLRSVLDEAPQHVTFALMLMRLVVLKQPAGTEARSNEERSRSTQLVADLLLNDKLNTLPAQSMAWCVLSNAAGAARPSGWSLLGATDGATDGVDLAGVIDRALRDGDPATEGAAAPAHVARRQSAVAFLYNLTRDDGNHAGAEGGEGAAELSEGATSILLGCLEHFPSETDATTCRRYLMSVGQLLTSRKFGGTAIALVKDLGLVDEGFGEGKGTGVEDLAKEVLTLLE